MSTSLDVCTTYISSFLIAHDRVRTGVLFLTKEVLNLLSYVGRNEHQQTKRETGFEPATLSLEG